MGARPGLAEELLIQFNVQKKEFLTNKAFCHPKMMTLRAEVLQEAPLQAWLLPDLNTIPDNCVGENSF